MIATTDTWKIHLNQDQFLSKFDATIPAQYLPCHVSVQLLPDRLDVEKKYVNRFAALYEILKLLKLSLCLTPWALATADP